MYLAAPDEIAEDVQEAADYVGTATNNYCLGNLAGKANCTKHVPEWIRYDSLSTINKKTVLTFIIKGQMVKSLRTDSKMGKQNAS